MHQFFASQIYLFKNSNNNLSENSVDFDKITNKRNDDIQNSYKKFKTKIIDPLEYEYQQGI